MRLALRYLQVRVGLLFLAAAVLISQPDSADAGLPVFGVIMTVNSANDVDDTHCNPMHCSLREAILTVNGAGPGSIIKFDIAGCPPACTISPQGILPAVTNDGITIDGETEPDFSGVPLITVDGSALPGNQAVLSLTGDSAVLRGLEIRNGPGLGISISSPSYVIERSVVKQNALGGISSPFSAVESVTIRGNSIVDNGGFGVIVEGNESVVISDNFVGGNALTGISTGAGDGAPVLQVSDNEVTGNGVSGIEAYGIELTVDDNIVTNNGRSGIYSQASGQSTISGNSVIANGQLGLQPFDAGIATTGPTVATANTVMNNTGPGFFTTSGNLSIGLGSPNDGNTIASNGGSGVLVPFSPADPASAVSVLGNSIHSNGGLGIDLQEELDTDGVVTPNDAGDGDDGANHLQNFPILDAAVLGSLHVSGTVDSTASTAFRIEFFLNQECDPSGHGEGQELVGVIDVTTNGSGVANFDASLDVAASPGDQITSTLTNETTNDTSEFSPCVEATSPATPTPTPGPSTPTPTPVGQSPTPTPVPTATPPPSGLTQGDNDCDGDSDAVDALVSLEKSAGIDPNQQPGCPNLGVAVPVGAVPAGDTPPLFGDIDCDGDVDAVDALQILRNIAGLPVNQNAGCPAIGDPL